MILLGNGLFDSLDCLHWSIQVNHAHTRPPRFPRQRSFSSLDLNLLFNRTVQIINFLFLLLDLDLLKLQAFSLRLIKIIDRLLFYPLGVPQTVFKPLPGMLSRSGLTNCIRFPEDGGLVLPQIKR